MYPKINAEEKEQSSAPKSRCKNKESLSLVGMRRYSILIDTEKNTSTISGEQTKKSVLVRLCLMGVNKPCLALV